MEFLRFGSSIPGGYWGCCAVDIIQNFKFDPDAAASIQIVSGDAGTPMMKNGELVFAGKTYREIFETRLRITTFNTSDMPNHAFFAVLTQEQIDGNFGKKWLAILREHGFEFVRTVSNSVYTGPTVGSGGTPHPNHIFGLFRNIGKGAIADPFTPPAAWTALPEPKSDLEIWEASSPTKTYTEAELEVAGVPITYAGLRSKFPPQLKAKREEALKAAKTTATEAAASPW